MQLFESSKAYKIVEGDAEAGRLSHAYLLVCPDAKNLRGWLKELAALLLGADARAARLIAQEHYSDCRIFPAEGEKGWYLICVDGFSVGWGKLAGGLTLLSFSAPGFFLCVLAIFLFSVVLGWLPAAGMYSAGGGGSVGDLLLHLILPAGVVCLSSLGNLVRQTASACGEVLGEDYIRTARAKGLPEWAVVWKHGFRTALLPVVTTILNHIPHIIGGSLIVERIFGWPGMGSLLFTSVSSRDYTVIMGLTVVIALTVLATGILMDLVYRLADPGVGWGGEAR